MNRSNVSIAHEFVDAIPDKPEEGTLYVSVGRAIAVHRCFCGCGFEVVTPLSPIDWRLIFDGETVSLKPSIGNWSSGCRSHYWITRDRVLWSSDFSRGKIERLRARDKARRQGALGGSSGDPDLDDIEDEADSEAGSWLRRVQKGRRRRGR
jgi:hypothetical protein